MILGTSQQEKANVEAEHHCLRAPGSQCPNFGVCQNFITKKDVHILVEMKGGEIGSRQDTALVR